MRTGLSLVVLLALSTLSLAGDRDATEEARRLEKEGKDSLAFAGYLRIDGAEHLAIRLARRDPGKYLGLLAEAGTEVPRWRVEVLAGDLLLASGKRDEALERYRRAARELADATIYLVDPPPREPGLGRRKSPVAPFDIGPGSHRDNWLIRRFLALGAFEDAGREFARIRELHRPQERPSYTGRGLQFAVDHAFFFLQRERKQEALECLLAPLLLLDMDRVPGLAGPASPWQRYHGMSRKAYVRLAYGICKTAGEEEALDRALREQVAVGHHRALRVLAEVRRHQGRPDEARELELRYLDDAGIAEPGRSWRRGRILEEAGQIEQAVREYEHVFAVPWARPDLPDGDPPPHLGFSQFGDVSGPGGLEARSKGRLLERLQHLYASLGKTEEMLATVLSRYELRPDLLGREREVDRDVARFTRAGLGVRLAEWAEGFLPRIPRAEWRANLLFSLGDHSGAAGAVAEAAAGATGDVAGLLQHWRQRFGEAGGEPLRILLETLVEADPADARSRLMLLDLDGDGRGERAIAVMEEILTGKARYDYGRRGGKGTFVDFGSPFDLAYRLMRLLERHGRIEDLSALGLRIARGDSPFTFEASDLRRHRGGNGKPEHGNACLALAVLHAGEGDLLLLEAALARSSWRGALAQVRRRRGGRDRQREPRAEIGWANLPEGVRLLASHGSVLSVARDGEYLYAGHPWGVGVYDHEGEPVTRVALNDCALALAVKDGTVWAGGTTGLFRISRGDWKVDHLWLAGPRAKRTGDDAHRKSRVSVLGLDGDDLWIGVGGAVKVLDTRTLDLRTYSKAEVRIDDRIFFEESHVWVGDGKRVYRYDRRTDTWRKVEHSFRIKGAYEELHLIGDVDGDLFGSIRLGDPLRHRPCIIDRETLALEPVLIDARPGDPPITVNSPLAFLGRLDGRPVFGGEHGRFIFEAESKKLRPVPRDEEGSLLPIEGLVPSEVRVVRPFRLPGGVVTFRGGAMVRMPDGSAVVGRIRSSSPRYRYRREDWPFELIRWEVEPGSGGLCRYEKGGRGSPLSRAPTSDSLLSDSVLCLVKEPEGDRIWLGTEQGLAVLDAGFRVVESMTRGEGLISNRVIAAAALGGKLFFASAWADCGGGLTVFHPEKEVLTARLRQDGLGSDKIQSISVEDGKLRVVPGAEYLRHGDGRYRLAPPCLFDPETGVVECTLPERILDENEARESTRPPRRGPMRFLGGEIIAEHLLDGNRVICGTRGLEVTPEGTELGPEIAEIPPRIVPSTRQRLVAEAGSRRERFETREAIALALRDENPYRRANVLAAAARIEGVEVADLAAEQLEDPVLRVRTSALYLLTRVEDDEAVRPHLLKALGDPDAYVRAVATIDLCRRGSPPDVAFLREILARRGGFGNFPTGAKSSFGVEADRLRLYRAVAPHATPEVFAVLLEHPLVVDDYKPRGEALAGLGEALRKRPEAARILLGARGREQVSFARAVFGFAGKALLPALLEGLASRDRVVRSNAALGCGAVGDAVAIPHLLRALDLESGLSRAAIVKALGDLKAVEALPRLARLYVAAQEDPGGGYRAGQTISSMSFDYDRIGSLADIAAEWDELQASALRAATTVEPREKLLTPKVVLDAVRRIGPEASQAFHRRLASDKDAGAREEAAVGLAGVATEDLEQNLPVLRSLLADGDLSVATQAAVSLLLLGRESARTPILEWLHSRRDWERRRILVTLLRIEKSGTVAFALDRIREIARDERENRWIRKAARKILRGLGESR